MQKESNSAGIIFVLLITLFLLSDCSELFKDTETVIIDNQSIYTIVVFINSKYKSTVAQGTTYQFGLYTNTTYALSCTSGSHQWGPISVNLTKGEPYTWSIENPPEPTPTQVPEGEIIIENNSIYNINITISGNDEGILEAGNNKTILKEIGTHYCYAIAIGTSNYWQNTIELQEDGYIWRINDDIEFFPESNYKIYNFENNYLDHEGLNGWSGNFTDFSITNYKYGFYSLTRDISASPGASGNIIKPCNCTFGDSLSLGLWIYLNENMYSIQKIAGYWGTSSSISQKIQILIDAGTVRFLIERNDNTTTEDYLINLYDSSWHYLAFSYDSENDILYGIVDNNLLTIDTIMGNWEAPASNYNQYIQLSFPAVSCDIHIDEFIMSTNEFIDPQIFADHYTHGIPWGGEYTPE